MNPYISAPKNLLYFSLFFLTGGLDPGDQICLCRADFLLYREENAALVLAVVFLRIGCIAVSVPLHNRSADSHIHGLS